MSEAASPPVLCIPGCEMGVAGGGIMGGGGGEEREGPEIWGLDA